jgi:hypothetical protein
MLNVRVLVNRVLGEYSDLKNVEVPAGCKSSTRVFHGNIWGSGGLAPVILKISTIWEQEDEGNNNNNNLFLMC